MATLAVLKFDTPAGAQQTVQVIQQLGKQELVTLQDAAIVTWPEGKKKPNKEVRSYTANNGVLSLFGSNKR